MITSFRNGNKIYLDTKSNKWCYMDGIEVNKEDRKCPKCGEFPTIEGYDACLGELPGVKEACCGHGVRQGYMILNDGKKINI